MTNDERNPNTTATVVAVVLSPNVENSQLCGRRFRHSDFVIPSDFLIRHSDLRIAVGSIKRPVSGLVRAAGGGSVQKDGKRPLDRDTVRVSRRLPSKSKLDWRRAACQDNARWATPHLKRQSPASGADSPSRFTTSPSAARAWRAWTTLSSSSRSWWWARKSKSNSSK